MPLGDLSLGRLQHLVEMLDFVRSHLAGVAMVTKNNTGDFLLFNFGIVTNEFEDKDDVTYTLVVDRKD